MIYGRSKDDLNKFLHEDQEKEAQWYLEQPADFWIDLMKETFPVSPRIRILAYPSRKLYQKMITDEADRVEKQKKKLGKEGLKKAAMDVAEAIKSQILPPQEVLESIPVADVNKIMYR
jgi:Zn-dependent M16 (insulinase) family peptidase